jgi:hypothetical protein
VAAEILADRSLLLSWTADDANLNPGSLRLEGQDSPTGAWMPLTSSAATPVVQNGANQIKWQPPEGRAPATVRISIADLAGNFAAATASVRTSPAAPVESPLVDSAPPSSGWTSTNATSPATLAVQRATASQHNPVPPANQTWPADGAPLTSYRLYDSAAGVPADRGTRYGNPLATLDDSNSRPATAVANDSNTQSGLAAVTLEPFRQASLRRLPAIDGREFPANPPFATAESNRNPRTAPVSQELAKESAAVLKRVNSRTFALEYELADSGGFGVSRVELWGTRDGGKTWRRYAQDDDLRSPVQTTVESEGRYGFRLVAESAGGAPAASPQPGDVPELSVEVDLHRPFAELTAVELAGSNRAGQLILRWRAEDDNLEPRPIALYYSSRPAGPWSVIAAELENTGEYVWRVERHVPDRCYLRLEARDMAGNKGAFQTLEPISIERPNPSAQFRTAVPTGAASSR